MNPNDNQNQDGSQEETKKIEGVYDNVSKQELFGVHPVTIHTHNGIDAPRIPPTSVQNFVPLPATKGTNGVLATGNIGLSTPPFGIVYPLPIINGYGVGTFSQFNGGTAPLGSVVIFSHPALPLYQLWVSVLDTNDIQIWKGVELTLTA